MKMKKKKYTAPQIEAIEVKLETHLLATSVDESEGNRPIIQGNPDDSKKDDAYGGYDEAKGSAWGSFNEGNVWE